MRGSEENSSCRLRTPKVQQSTVNFRSRVIALETPDQPLRNFKRKDKKNFEPLQFKGLQENDEISRLNKNFEETRYLAGGLDAEYRKRLEKNYVSLKKNTKPKGNETPLRSPSRKRFSSGPMDPMFEEKVEDSIYSDRFIPSRVGSNLNEGFQLPLNPKYTTPYSYVLETQIFGSPIRRLTPPGKNIKVRVLGNENKQNNVFRGNTLHNDMENPNRVLRFRQVQEQVSADRKPPAFGLSPISLGTQRMLLSPKRTNRNIPKSPFKVLDAPQLTDDFYLNLVDWSNQNVLAVGLGSCVYLWSACTSKVTKLTELNDAEDGICSVSWSPENSRLAVGTRQGKVQIWDGIKCKKITSMNGHIARVGTLAWNDNILASGSRDRNIYLRDPRINKDYTSKLVAHRQEVCGLKWSFDKQHLASGGNDNKLLVWDLNQDQTPLFRFTEHTAAVKAIAWSPHQHGLLASGGGTADRCIRFWNTLTSAHPNPSGIDGASRPLQILDTGSQVCNLLWSKNVNEIVSTHGYSKNEIIIWKYPSMTKLASLTGHSYRVLYLASSPDGQTIVTGAGDETLRFWNVFPECKVKDNKLESPNFSSVYNSVR